jgi:hypothetical protein
VGLGRDVFRSLLAEDTLTMGVTTAALRLATKAQGAPEGAILDPVPAVGERNEGPDEVAVESVEAKEEHFDPEERFVVDDPINARLDQVDLTALLQRVAAEGEGSA